MKTIASNIKNTTYIIFCLSMIAILLGMFIPNTVRAEGVYDDDYADLEEDDDYADLVYVDCNTRAMTLFIGQTKKISVEIDDDYDTNYELIWKSDNESIASVDNNGVVKAKKEGKAKITVSYGNDKDSCTVTVKKKTPTYNKAAKKLKNLGKENKNFVFKNIDVGNVCRLYAKQYINVSDDSKFKSQWYMSGLVLKEYIELRKKGDGSVAKLVVDGRMVQVAYFESVNLNASQLKLSTKNRKLSFALDQTNSRSYISNNLYCGYTDAKAVIASNSNKNKEKLKKFNTMLGQKTFCLKFECEEGEYHKVGTTSTIRNNWKSLNKAFNKLMKIY